jgi:acyl-CoA reductase-like NAD-dependent aldehyde dehydrogenase
MDEPTEVRNFVAGRWIRPAGVRASDVWNPATGAVIARAGASSPHAGNIGINVGVAQPMASFPFSGWGDSSFGDLHAHGFHAVEFFTQTKVAVERWS